MKPPRALADCHNIMDLRVLARRALPAPIFDFLDGAAETEITALRNTTAFDDVPLVPRCLVETPTVNTATRILGQDIAWPILCSPTGASRLFHAEGELAVARATAKAGVIYCVSNSSTHSLEGIAAASSGPKVFQLYVKDRDIMWATIERAKHAKYPALCLTVDVPTVGKRERDLRSGFGPGLKPSWSVQSLLSFACHPGWVTQRLGKRALKLAHRSLRAEIPGAAPKSHLPLSWKDVRDIADVWKGPFALKGIMSADDARRAADSGVTAIMVSNHGGRQLDGALSTVEALPAVVGAVGDCLEVILDGGIRRGVHVLKALALGAKACSIGRPYLYGLSAGGEAGVARALNILRAELTLAMTLAGCTSIKNVDPMLVRRP